MSTADTSPPDAPPDFDGRVALVTGSATGLGLAIARRLQQGGARVVLNDVNEGALAATAAALGATTLALRADIAQESEANELVESVLARCGRLDLAVNNAAVNAPPMPTLEQTLADWQRTMDVNLRGTFLVARAAGRHMVARRAGCIVNVSSLAAIRAFPASNDYGVSKAAVAMLTQTLAAEWGRHGVRVNAVAPGFTDAPMLARMFAASPRPPEDYLRRIPLRRLGRAEEIAELVAFLGSERASYITGAVIPIDGGWSANGGP